MMRELIAWGTLILITLVVWVPVVGMFWRHERSRHQLRASSVLIFRHEALAGIRGNLMEIRFSGIEPETDDLLDKYYHKTFVIRAAVISGVIAFVAGVALIAAGYALYTPLTLSIVCAIASAIGLHQYNRAAPPAFANEAQNR